MTPTIGWTKWQSNKVLFSYSLLHLLFVSLVLLLSYALSYIYSLCPFLSVPFLLLCCSLPLLDILSPGPSLILSLSLHLSFSLFFSLFHLTNPLCSECWGGLWHRRQRWLSRMQIARGVTNLEALCQNMI